MTYTLEDTARLVAMAGPDFAWRNGPFNKNEPARPSSKVRKALRDDLAARQGYICPQCGHALNRDGMGTEFCHIVARGPEQRGFVRGGIFSGHSACNASTKPQFDADGNLVSGIAVLTPDMFARPDLVPNEWTPFPVLAAR